MGGGGRAGASSFSHGRTEAGGGGGGTVFTKIKGEGEFSYPLQSVLMQACS